MSFSVVNDDSLHTVSEQYEIQSVMELPVDSPTFLSCCLILPLRCVPYVGVVST